MDIFAEDFDLDKALKKGGAEAAAELDKVLSSRLDELKRRVNAGLKREEFNEAMALEAALVAARNIVHLRQSSLASNS